MKFVALLRGINVGGNNIIKMADLKACFERMGMDNVATFIQSGNVLFESREKNRKTLTEKIEKVLSQQFSYTSVVVIVSYAELKNIVKLAPKGFGTQPGKYRSDVIFLKPAFTAKTLIKDVEVREGVDMAHAGKGVLYFSRLISKASKSYLSKIIELPAYKHITIRNWNTTTKLLTLMEKKI